MGCFLQARAWRGLCASPACALTAAATGPCTVPVLRVLDFEFTAAAGCYIQRKPCSHSDAIESCRSCARPLELRTSAPVVAVAAHPQSEDVVVGLQASHRSIAAPFERVLSFVCPRREAICRFLRRRRTAARARRSDSDARALKRGPTTARTSTGHMIMSERIQMRGAGPLRHCSSRHHVPSAIHGTRETAARLRSSR